MPTDLKLLMDDALSGLQLSPSLAADAKLRYARRQRRRRAAAGIVTAAVAAISAVLLWSAGSTSHSGDARLIPVASPAPPQPTRYVATGILLTDPKHGEPLNVCGAVALSLPPQCGLVPVRGVDIKTLPTVRTLNGVTWTDKAFRLVGTYSGGVLTVTESPTLAPPAAPITDPNSLALPCSPPPGGWTDHSVDGPDEGVLSAYGAAHSDTFGGLWLGDSQRVAVVSTTGDLGTARQEIRRIYAGNLCVTKAKYSEKFLETAVAQLNTEAVGRELAITMTADDVVHSRLDLGVVIENKVVTDYLAAHFPAGLVRVTPFLVPVQSACLRQRAIQPRGPVCQGSPVTQPRG